MPHEPIALAKLGSTEVIAYACGKCGVVAAGVGTERKGSRPWYGAGLFSDEEARLFATNHCGPWVCEECGAEHDRYHQPLCIQCWAKASASRRLDQEEKRFAAAEKLTSWDGPVYSDELGQFFRDVDEMLDAFECEGLKPPLYAWTCITTHPHLDLAWLAEEALLDAPDGAELHALDELEEFIRGWNAKQTYEIWEPNYKKVLVLKYDRRKDGDS